jgi:hypothetical protein
VDRLDECGNVERVVRQSGSPSRPKAPAMRTCGSVERVVR